jgi:hypothetical protein
VTEAVCSEERDGGRPPAAAGRSLLVAALGLLVVLVILEVAAGPALTPAHGVGHEAQVLAIPGVASMVHSIAIPAELGQVAGSQRQPAPLAIPAQALIDGLLLVSGAGLAWPRLRTPRGGRGRALHVASGGGGVVPRARLGSFLASLAILVAGIAVGVAAISRLRLLVALYLTPQLGTLSYLLLYGSSERRPALVVLAVVMSLKLAAIVLFARSLPRVAWERGIAGLALTSVAATVVATFGVALAPPSQGSIVDALVASIAALAAILWAGVIVSGSVRRLPER